MRASDERRASIRHARGNSSRYGGHCRVLLGTMATRRGEFDLACRLMAESLNLYRAIDSKFDIAGSPVKLGFLMLHQRNPTRALELFRETSDAGTQMTREQAIEFALDERHPS
jgi:hypothetical protein